jgi:hypothetical protein
MKAAPKLLSIGILVLWPLVFAACSSNSAQPATYTIDGTVVNLSGAAGGLVLENNLTDRLFGEGQWLIYLRYFSFLRCFL